MCTECESTEKLLKAGVEELSKFCSECRGFDTWLTASEQKISASRERFISPSTLEQQEADHKVCYSNLKLIVQK